MVGDNMIDIQYVVHELWGVERCFLCGVDIKPGVSMDLPLPLWDCRTHRWAASVGISDGVMANARVGIGDGLERNAPGQDRRNDISVWIRNWWTILTRKHCWVYGSRTACRLRSVYVALDLLHSQLMHL